ncbi:uncharacterized protein [Littorina saxatilis]|uniref:WSC domain-containing protein n=1 Tax=Littorina saxatilis TaxID=31220 RepID=A0AAN9GDE3_9CAEN
MASCTARLVLLQLLLMFPLPCQPSMVRHLGCMVQTDSEKEANMERSSGRESEKATGLAQERGAFQALVGDSSQMTVHVCVERCWMKRYTLAAMQEGTRCFCANSQIGLAPVDTALCHEVCSGNSKQICGGRIALSVYYTGFEEEPEMFDADVSRGLIGCFTEESWKSWCEAPIAKGVLNKQRLNQGQGWSLRNDGSDEDMMAAYKPPLVSVRMSALLCASYCASGAHGDPVAVLKSNNTCCCGRSLTKSGVSAKDKVDFALFCNAPCADQSSRPYCVGIWKGRHYISVYNTFEIWPVPGMRPQGLDAKGSWLQPVYPPNERFETTAFKPKWAPPEKAELAGVDLFLPDQLHLPPIVDPANLAPYVSVVDEPQEDSHGGGWLWTIVVILLILLLLSLAVAYIIYLIRERMSKEFDDTLQEIYPIYVHQEIEQQPEIDDMIEIHEHHEEMPLELGEGQYDEIFYDVTHHNANKSSIRVKRDGPETPTQIDQSIEQNNVRKSGNMETVSETGYSDRSKICGSRKESPMKKSASKTPFRQQTRNSVGKSPMRQKINDFYKNHIRQKIMNGLSNKIPFLRDSETTSSNDNESFDA